MALVEVGLGMHKEPAPQQARAPLPLIAAIYSTGSWHPEERQFDHLQICEVDPFVAIHVTNRIMAEKRSPEDKVICEIHDAIVIEVSVTGVSESVSVRVALIAVRDKYAVIKVIDNAVAVRVTSLRGQRTKQTGK